MLEVICAVGVAASFIFQVVWIWLHWDFFRPGGELHRTIYHSENAKRWRRLMGK